MNARLDQRVRHEAETTRGELTALSQLGLDEGDLVALRRQGFVAVGERGNCKLRFRRERRQRTRYLGRDPAFIKQVREELADWQEAAHQTRNLQRWLRTASRALRAAKQTLAPLLATQRSYYHGLAIRRRRGAERRSAVSGMAPSFLTERSMNHD